jgi:hypothetical protein
MTTRRRLLLTAAGAGSFCKFGASLLAWAASGFWNRKRSTEWSPEEIQQITTRSPWARGTNFDFEEAEDPTPVPGTGSPYAGTNGDGRGGTIEKPVGIMGRAPVLARWESARPIRDALLVPLPRGFEDRYVISLSNIPPEAMNSMLNRRRPSGEPAPSIPLEAMLEELQAGSTLEVPGKDPAGAGIVRRLAGHDSTYLFGFSKEFLPLSVNDKEAIFTLRTLLVSVKVKFELKDMMYRGSLAV